jgi:hypothetical protein
VADLGTALVKSIDSSNLEKKCEPNGRIENEVTCPNTVVRGKSITTLKFYIQSDPKSIGIIFKLLQYLYFRIIKFK